MTARQTEFEAACRELLYEILLLDRGDRLLIYIDRPVSEVAAPEIQAYALTLGIETEILDLRNLDSEAAMVDALCSAMNEGNFAGVCEFSDRYFYLTPVWRHGVQKGCRLLCTGSMTEESLIRCIGEVDRDRMWELGMTLYRLLLDASRIRIETPAGTRISCRMNTGSLVGRVLSKLHLSSMSQVWRPTGKLQKRGGATFLGGQLSLQMA